MASEDLLTNITATRTFLHDCFSKQPSADDFETMLAFNMMVPPKVRVGLSGRPLDATAVMSKLTIPVLVTHGAEDKNAKLDTAKYTASVIPNAKLSVYDGIGHSPFRGCRAFQPRTRRLRAHGQQGELTDAIEGEADVDRQANPAGSVETGS